MFVSYLSMYVCMGRDTASFRCVCHMPVLPYGTSLCVDMLREILLDAISLSIRPIFGGDFIAELDRVWRSGRLLEIQAESELTICNDSESLAYDKLWAFRSSSESRRVLDYTCVPRLAVFLDLA